MKIIAWLRLLFAKNALYHQSKKTNWQLERYEKAVTERNIFISFVFLAIVLIIFCLIVLLNVVRKKRIDPFVIQIDQSTGEANIVNPLTSTTLTGYESLSRYFIKKYINARETYNPVDFDTIARRYIKLSSTDTIYSQSIKYIIYSRHKGHL